MRRRDGGRGGSTGRVLVLTTAVLATVVVASSLVVAFFATLSTSSSQRTAHRYNETVHTAATVLVELSYAEGSQRGFLLTGDESYLQPYLQVRDAVPVQADLLVKTDPADLALTVDIRRLAGLKMAEVARTLDLRRRNGADAALALVRSDNGRQLMDGVTADLFQLDTLARSRLAEQERSTAQAQLAAAVSLAVGTVAGIALLVLLLWLMAQRRRLAAGSRDAEAAREVLVAELSQLATHDALTGLPNRRLVADRLEQALLRCRPGQVVGVLFIDLDHFKQVNDQYGHLRGDDVLVHVARAMRAALRPADTLARVGGDEFVAVCEGLTGEQDGRAVAGRLQAATAEPLAGLAVNVAGSVGIAFSNAEMGEHDPGESGQVELLLEAADAAMYRAKEQGRGQVAVYGSAVADARSLRRRDTGALSRAFEAGELWVAYQPVLRLDTEQITGVEALLRWTDPNRGAISPEQFIPTAEESGLIGPIGEFVLRTACAQVAEWNRLRAVDGLPELTVAVNVSGRQLTQPGFLCAVRHTLAATGLRPALLCVEITESVLIDSVAASATELDWLSELGVRIALDDFGTGYSSLAYLRRFPIDIVKVDRSFVAGIATNVEDAAIVAAIVGLARTLGRDTIAEGIEHVEQAGYLRELGCQFGQGFLYAKALPALDLEALLLTRAVRAGTG